MCYDGYDCIQIDLYVLARHTLPVPPLLVIKIVTDTSHFFELYRIMKVQIVIILDFVLRAAS